MTGRTNGNHLVNGYDLMGLLGKARDMGVTGLHVSAKGRPAIHYRYVTEIQDRRNFGWQVWLAPHETNGQCGWVPVNYEYALGHPAVSIPMPATVMTTSGVYRSQR